MDKKQRQEREAHFQQLLKRLYEGEPVPDWFDLKFTQNLIDDYDLSSSPEKLRSDLNNIAFAYLQWGPYGVRDPRSEEEKAEVLGDVVKHLEAVVSALWGPAQQYWPDAVQRVSKIQFLGPDSEITTLGQLGINTDRMTAALTLRILNELVEHFSTQKPDQKKRRVGHPEEKGTEYFVRYVLDLWTDLSGRPATIDSHDGEPTSPALVFAAKILDQIDHEAPKTAILTAARKIKKNPWPD